LLSSGVGSHLVSPCVARLCSTCNFYQCNDDAKPFAAKDKLKTAETDSA
jgi:hypothetical protein